MASELSEEQLQYARSAHYKTHVLAASELYEVASLDRGVLLRLLDEHAALKQRVADLESENKVLREYFDARTRLNSVGDIDTITERIYAAFQAVEAFDAARRR